MAGNILSSLLSESKVSFYNETFKAPAWLGMSVAKVEVSQPTSNADQPLYARSNATNEKEASPGVLSSDLKTAKIIEPLEIKVAGYCNDLTTLDSIMYCFALTDVTVQVTSKTVIATAMALTAFEIEHSSECLSSSKVNLSFERVTSAPPPPFAPGQAADNSLIGQGMKALESVTATATNTINSIKSKLGF